MARPDRYIWSINDWPTILIHWPISSRAYASSGRHWLHQEMNPPELYRQQQCTHACVLDIGTHAWPCEISSLSRGPMYIERRVGGGGRRGEGVIMSERALGRASWGSVWRHPTAGQWPCVCVADLKARTFIYIYIYIYIYTLRVMPRQMGGGA